MSRSTIVHFEDRQIWVFDEALGIWMKYAIEAAMRRDATGRGSWMTGRLDAWRVSASLAGHVVWRIDDGRRLTLAERRAFVDVAAEACDSLDDEGPRWHAHVRTWSLVDDIRLVERFGLWDDPLDLKPVVELGQAVIGLVEGTPSDAPAGTAWFYGWPGGRTTIPVRAVSE